MDYIVLAIFAVIGIILFLIYREFKNVREDIQNVVEQFNMVAKDNNMKMIKNLESNVGQYIMKIKQLGDSNIQQLHRIHLLNHQKVTRNDNHFTEAEDSVGNHENENDLRYLSDTKISTRSASDKKKSRDD